MSANIVRFPPATPVDLTLRDYHIDRAAGNLGSIGQIVDAAAQTICGLYGKSPSSFLRVVNVGDGLIDNNRPIFDDLCAPISPLPPQPSPPFTGGRCDAVRYDVTLTILSETVAFNPTRLITQSTTITDRVYGPIGSVYVDNPGSNSADGLNWDGFRTVEIWCRGGGGESLGAPHAYSPYGGNSPTIQSAVITNAVRVDGQPDTCGNQQPGYPPPSRDPGDYTRIFPVPQPDGSTKNTTVTIVPTFAPITGIFRPEVNVDVGGINVNFSLGGFTLSPTIEIPVGSDFPVNQPGGTTNNKVSINPTSTGSGLTVDLQPVLDKIAEVKAEVEECCDRYHPFSELLTSDYDVSNLGSGSSGVYNLPAKTYRVTLQITNPDEKGRSQAGINAPNVLYAGWAWFRSGGGMLTRHPIDSVIKSFDVPARSDDSFAFTLNGSYNANVIAYFSKK